MASYSSSSAKEPVKLREKVLANGNRSLYLDYSAGGRRVREFLKLYLIPGSTRPVRIANDNTLSAARAIKAQRILDLTQGKAGIGVPGGRVALAAWIDKVIDMKRSRGKLSESGAKLYRLMCERVEDYHPGARLGDVDKRFCIGFIDFLRHARKNRGTSEALSPNTQRAYFSFFNAVLNEAVRAGRIDRNPVAMVSPDEKVSKPETSREYLTEKEVEALIRIWEEEEREERREEKKQDLGAFLFCCFCGLRHSDVEAMQWRDIDQGMIRLRQKKTGTEVVIPLSRNAWRFLPERPREWEGKKVFRLSSLSTAREKLRRAAEAAGIKKRVTFHVSRHTFATMILTAGADLYTTSKLLGHTDVKTTQVYARIVDRKKVEAVGLLDRLFE